MRTYFWDTTLDRASYFEYDPNNRMVKSTDVLGHWQYFHYDANGNQDWARDGAGDITCSHYDAANRRIAVVDPLGNPTYYEYDPAGRQTKEIDAQGQPEVLHYDLAGRVSQRDKASGVGAYYAYDAAGRVTDETRYPSGDTIRTGYDARGAVVSIKKTGVPTESWQYDLAGQVTRYSSVTPPPVTPGLPMGLNSPGFVGRAVRSDIYYTYDQAGNRESMLFCGAGVTYFTYYAYDERNQLASLTDPLGQTVYYERDELGREVVKALPNGVTTYHKYNDASEITDIIHQGPSGVLQSLNYKYADDGQRTKIVREDGTSIYYGYDDAHRLTSEDWLDVTDVQLYAFAYEYDAAGNRKKKTFNGEVTYYDYNDLNQLETESILAGDATYYTWTADGEMATKHGSEGWTYYTWDVDESLKKIEAPNVTLENKYNSRMQRVWRSEDGQAESLIYDSQKLIAEASSGSLSRYYLSEGGSAFSPLVRQLGSQHWFLFDALGTTLGLTADGGGLSDTFRYEAFGTSLGRTGATATPYQYVGGYGYFKERSVGLEQVWWRWLAQRSAHWLSRDFLSSSPSYAYAANNPQILIDPMGLQAGGPGPLPPTDPNYCNDEIQRYYFGGPDPYMPGGWSYGQCPISPDPDNGLSRCWGNPKPPPEHPWWWNLLPWHWPSWPTPFECQRWLENPRLR
ncbi:MAG: RHS repeat-associated core domain-containing protein [Armatimonadota bacterium]